MSIVLQPHFIIHPVDAYAATPFTATFTCSAQGHGVLSIEWKREGSLELSSQSNQTILFPEITESYINSTLVLYNVTDIDAGKYYCTASNEMKASNSTTANLIFSGK